MENGQTLGVLFAPEQSALAAPAAFSVDELAAFFRISRASVWRLLKKGSLARTRIGGRTVIRRIDADAFLARAAAVA
ncbi:helix-turn-helix domain-containing protein [Methylobacterium cerastii]|uniref:helix-turn-helix domain-containing protein n=1 Tax=Methylobacterium cerastii TaxID=932741 RepID=UPI001EE1DCFF|nr:helix-turn-helix domain-containing protein [Methylobacterium cerastii]